MRLGCVMRPTQKRIIAYSGDTVDLCGEVAVPIIYNGITKYHTFLVVRRGNVNLFGRDLCSEFKIVLSLPNSKNEIASNNIVGYNVLSQFKDYLFIRFFPIFGD